MAISTLRVVYPLPCNTFPSHCHFLPKCHPCNAFAPIRLDSALVAKVASRPSSFPPLPSTLFTAACAGARAATTAFIFLILTLGCSVSPAAYAAPPSHLLTNPSGSSQAVADEDKVSTKFEAWKKKTFALTVPLRIVGLNGSFPASWLKEFKQSQGKRLRLNVRFVGSLENIFSQLLLPFEKKTAVKAASTVAADIVSVGDSWLSSAIKNGLIVPIDEPEDQEWFKKLNVKWKTHLRRNTDGDIDSEGSIWGAPYRWGTMVIAYKRSTFQKRKLAPIEDWADLWRPELAGRIAMVDSPREVIGAVLKYMGASYNVKNIDLQVPGGRPELEKNLSLLCKQVCLFDSMYYLKAFGVGDAWVAVGWSSDILPVAKRMSNVTVVAPKSGTSLWADLWAIPAACRLQTNQLGARIRGPSPLIHQWIEFCMQSARSLPFRQEVIPGAIPSALDSTCFIAPSEFTHNDRPMLDTNLEAGVPPPDILSRCEFLEPLPEAVLSDVNSMISSTKSQSTGLIRSLQNHLLPLRWTWMRPR